jgi:hypothetical protein
MKKLKRALWFCFASCCCAGLWLTTGATANSPSEAGRGGEVKDSLISYCPLYLYWQLNGTLYYVVAEPDLNCNPVGLYSTTEMQMQMGCDCPDPILATHTVLQPLPKVEETAELAPQPDPMFSGVLR